VANDIEAWPRLFLQKYREVEVLERDGNRVVFRVTTFPFEDGQTHTWVSERILDPAQHLVTARRLESGPFSYMHIFQEYVEADGGTRVRWVHDFEMKDGSPVTDGEMAERINRDAQRQLEHQRQIIEGLVREGRSAITEGVA
jgi:aromatase